MQATQHRSTTTESDCFVGRRMAAIVFVDIVSSTEALLGMTDRAWVEVLDALDATTERLVAELDGTISNRLGDGYLVLFDGASRAVRFGELLVAATAELDIELRVGVHAGEVESQGSQTVGASVHAAARIQSAAEPGEILVSESVTILTLGSGLEFLPRGERELKGLPGRWRLWTLA